MQMVASTYMQAKYTHTPSAYPYKRIAGGIFMGQSLVGIDKG